MGATGRDSIGRHRLFVTDTRRRQRRQGGLAEQHLHIGAQAGLAHALHQLHRQQRMPAQLEEMVMAAHWLHIQQLGPDLRQCGLHALLWRFEAAGDKGFLGR